MGLKDELESLYLKNNKCSVGKLLDRLDEQDRQDMIDILADPEVPLKALSRLSDAKGWKIHRDTFSRHREGGCICR